ncbi:hypothetical protein SAMN05414137_110108 [Streptacidiphilus jiangxiensis]|uniref:Uncharacterized protein n=1 Tax=Streptacidiphilus jiangxiensis TaxID=235985 RepID=A0A1H7RG03_STRJI|nr:hypothetical protein SAMN05414137_110108 [Streptacidiphilus jiangxiensis]
MPFNPRFDDMARDRNQVLYRHRPGQTFDHKGGYTAQVVQYGRDEEFEGPLLDREHLVGEAVRFVSRWRSAGRASAQGADRAPEFPQEGGLGNRQYEVVIPGKVFCRVWPRVVRCARVACGLVWTASDPRPGVDDWPPACPACGNKAGNRQLQFVFAHRCGEVAQMQPPRSCPRNHTTFKLDDRASRFRDFRWECMTCGFPYGVQWNCNNPSCSYSDKYMQPLLHSAGAAHVGQGFTLVNATSAEEARRAAAPTYTVAVLGRWLEEITEDEFRRLTDGLTTDVPPEVLSSIEVMEANGLHDAARALRARFMPVDVGVLKDQVRKALGLEPDSDAVRQIATQLHTFRRVLNLERVDIDRLEREARNPERLRLYNRYRGALVNAGFDPATSCLIGDLPVTYVAVGYSRTGFTPDEADLVPYRGRAGRGAAVSTLLYANPTQAEALLFQLDPERVHRWLVRNGLVTNAALMDAGGVRRWLLQLLGQGDGEVFHRDTRPAEGDPEGPVYELFGLLHSLAHQLLRALAVDSGYSETSLSEYLFPHDLAFALYPNGGAEFSLGALRTVIEQNLDAVVTRAKENDSCLYDPNCMLSSEGADLGCLLLPETACQHWNRNLSRWHLFGDPEGDRVGYWDPAL